MTTATLAMSTPVDVLNHKKRFAEAIEADSVARTKIDAIKAAPRAAREWLISAARSLHLDAFTGSVGETVVRLWNAAMARIAQAHSFIGRTLGWRALSVYALTDSTARGYLARSVKYGYLTSTGALYKVASLLGKIPLVGGLLASAICTPLGYLDRAAIRTAVFVDDQVAKYDGHWIVNTAAEIAKGLMAYRVVRALVPARYRWTFYLAYLFKPAKRAYEVVKEDETMAKIGEQVERVKGTARAAAAESADIVVDRIMDGPDTPKVVYTTQPGTEAMDIIVVATGQRATVTVDIDSRGQKWITWDGVTYAAEEIGQGENDPIRPLPMDVVTKAMKAEEAAKASAAATSAPPLPRAVARATGGAPARARGKAKAGSGRR